jgi:hypothetical protein
MKRYSIVYNRLPLTVYNRIIKNVHRPSRRDDEIEMNQARRLRTQFPSQNSLKIEYIYSQGFTGYPENRVHRDYDVIERHGSSGFRLAT